MKQRSYYLIFTGESVVGLLLWSIVILPTLAITGCVINLSTANEALLEIEVQGVGGGLKPSLERGNVQQSAF